MVILMSALALGVVRTSFAQPLQLEELTNQILGGGYPSAEATQGLMRELQFQSAVQTYLWALPVLNMYGMKEGSEKTFGKGYNVLPVWKERLNAKTLITTPTVVMLTSPNRGGESYCPNVAPRVYAVVFCGGESRAMLMRGITGSQTLLPWT